MQTVLGKMVHISMCECSYDDGVSDEFVAHIRRKALTYLYTAILIEYIVTQKESGHARAPIQTNATSARINIS